MSPPTRIFATCDIGQPLRSTACASKDYAVEVYPEPQPPPKALVLEKVRSGIAALITTLRDRIDEEVFAAGAAAGLKVVSQIAVGVDNIDRAAANRHRIPYTHTADVLTGATAEYAFFMLGAVARRLYPAELQVRERTVDHLAPVPALAGRRGHRPHAGGDRHGPDRQEHGREGGRLRHGRALPRRERHPARGLRRGRAGA